MTTDLVAGLTVPTDLLRGGEWLAADDGGRFDVIDPATATKIADVANGTVADALASVESAADAAAGWAATAPRERARILLRAFDLMTEREDQLAELIVRENGKALTDALGEVRYAAEFFRWYAEEAVRVSGEIRTAPSGANRIMVIRQPIGIALLITPWNFPAAMATRKIGPALAAGCTVILKPASETPLTALAVGAILAEAGVPDGVEVGRTLLKTAADHVISSSMELGGNAPLLVLEDADIDVAVAGAMVAKMRNGGEACTAANRIYVHRSLVAEFTEKFGAAIGALTLGPGMDGAAVGPLVNAAAVDKVDELVKEAVSRGARVVVGGEAADGPGFYYRPTVLADVPVDAQIAGEEIFGPVAPVIAFDTDDEAIRLANDTEYGLVSYVFSQDLSRALRVSEALESGMVGINRGVVSDPAAPFGGVKQSGIGREGGHEGLLEYTESKYIAVDW